MTNQTIDQAWKAYLKAREVYLEAEKAYLKAWKAWRRGSQEGGK